MKKVFTYTLFGLMMLLLVILLSCETNGSRKSEGTTAGKKKNIEVLMEAENYTASKIEVEVERMDSTLAVLNAGSAGWAAFDIPIPVAGRYKSEIRLSSVPESGVRCWIEDYYDNQDDRTYNITGDIAFQGPSSEFITKGKDGSPLNAGTHKMKVHFDTPVKIDWIKFSLIKVHEKTPVSLVQKTEGSEWALVWSDEFDSPVVDTTKWTYDAGNWGWGNNENQYYTEARTENARIEDGNLIIEARKNDMGQEWTSARLTTRGKVSFTYGKIEFRAKVPSKRGNWAAGWTLGDDYVDELSWPYCGEIDILESVGYEMDDSTGNGVAHASAHSGAYYFKLGNQPTGVIDVENMNNEYHIYTVEWMPGEIRGYVDDRQYITYNDTSTDLSWPFSKPQNLILNLAMGGSWAGYYGIDESITSQKMIVDYVRVYELR